MAETPEEAEEDDYLSMTFAEIPGSAKSETSLQRAARLKKEAAERAKVPSKVELKAKQEAALQTGLATETNAPKGAMMMAKMGFTGGALGKTEDARLRPIELNVKDDRGGIGMESEKKRKVREAAEAAEDGEKRQKVSAEEFRERSRTMREEKRAEGLMWGAMKVLEGFESDATSLQEDDQSSADEAKPVKAKKERLRDVNVLYWPLLKQRLERERDRKMRYELNNSLSNRNDEDAQEAVEDVFDKRAESLDDEDPELEGFESLDFADRLEKIVLELREKYCYCFWCKYRYSNASMDGCPGLTEDEHG